MRGGYYGIVGKYVIPRFLALIGTAISYKYHELLKKDSHDPMQ